MATTYEYINSVIVGSGGSSSITFSSIPSTYTDLVLKVSARTNRSLEVDGLNVSFGSGTYNGRRLYGSGSSAGSDTTYTGMPFTTAASATSNTFGNAEIYIPNYTGSNNKTISVDGVGENNATTTYAGLGAGISSITSTISTITITSETSATFQQYSTFYLYGIKNS